VVLLPTAYTHPKGSFFMSAYDLVLLQVGYAFTDRTQVTLSGVPPLGAERVAFLDLSLKTAVARGPLVRAALLGSVSGLVARDFGILFVGRVGGVVQLCLRSSCGTSFTLSSNLTLAGPVLLMVNGVGGIARLTSRVSLLAEVATLVPLGTQLGQANGAAASGGFRIHARHFGVDLTLVHPFSGSAPVIPFVAVTYRSGPSR
jgi:hypothetical protein